MQIILYRLVIMLLNSVVNVKFMLLYVFLICLDIMSVFIRCCILLDNVVLTFCYFLNV